MVTAPLIAGCHCRRIKCLSFNLQSELFALFLVLIPPSEISSIQRGLRRETGLSRPVKYFTDCSKAILWIFYVLSFVHVFLFVHWGHLLGKG